VLIDVADTACCSVLQCVAVCCSVLQCVAMCNNIQVSEVVLINIADTVAESRRAR